MLPNEVTIAQTATTHASITVTTVASAWSCMTPARPLRPYSFISQTPSKPVMDDRRRTQTSVGRHPRRSPRPGESLHQERVDAGDGEHHHDPRDQHHADRQHGPVLGP